MHMYALTFRNTSCPPTSVKQYESTVCYWITQGNTEMTFLEAMVKCRVEADITLKATLAMIDRGNSHQNTDIIGVS